MNLQNPTQVQSRVDYYGVNGVPWGWIDGTSITNDCGYYDGAPACLSQTDIDDAYAVPSPFTLTLSHSLSADADSITVTLTITAVGSASGNLKARIAVVEKEIDFSVSPGSNGETVFENVMKQMLPNTTGTALPSIIDAGYTTTITASWKLANIYNLNEIAAVAFIQDDDDKTIYQTVYSDPLPALSNYATASISAANPITCTGSITPSVDVTNLGTVILTSATISYSVGSGTPQTYDWTGSLAAGATASDIQLPSIAVPNGANTLNASVSKINGSDFNAGLIASVPLIAIGLGTPAASPIVQDFQTAAYPPAGWFVANANGSATWKRSSSVGAYQTSPFGSTEYPFYTVTAPDQDELYVQNFDFSDASQTAAFMEFDYAKAKYSGLNDELMILASKDCGQTWTTLFDKDDNGGLSSVTSSSDWKPTSASQWKATALDMTQFIGESNVQVKFVAISGYGNNLYIDNVNIHYGSPTGVATPETSSLVLYPNPANQQVIIHVNGIISLQTKLEVVDVLGQVIYSTSAKSNSDLSVNTSEFNTGMYVYRLNDNGKMIAQDKFNVSH